MPLFLADTSIWAWADQGSRPDITSKLAQRFERGEIATCAPIVLEMLHRAPSGTQYDRLFRDLIQPLVWCDLEEARCRRALDVQRQLAHTTDGNHRRPAVDFLIAAVAEKAREPAVLWFFDKDLRLICEHTGQPFEAESAVAR
ncbi:MAG: PIN domain-containing protein [Candidatus Dormiibacterota bacterium]